MKRPAVVIAIALASCAACAQWRQVTHKDAITDEVFRFAESAAPSGETLLLTRRRDGSVWASIMTGKMLHPVEPRSPLIVRIDALEPMTYADEEAPGTGDILMQWTRAGAAFRVWHGIEGDGLSPFVKQVIAGRRLIVRYRNDNGDTRDATFSLGNERVVEQLLGLKPGRHP